MKKLEAAEVRLIRNDAGQRELVHRWKRARIQDIFQELADRLPSIVDMSEFGSDIAKLHVENINHVFVHPKTGGNSYLEGFSSLSPSPDVGQMLAYDIYRQIFGKLLYKSRSYNIYSIAINSDGFYGRSRNLGPVYLGDAASIDAASLRSRVFEHIENEKGGRKSLLSWTRTGLVPGPVNPYISRR